jgi:hypothetical protein
MSDEQLKELCAAIGTELDVEKFTELLEQVGDTRSAEERASRPAPITHSRAEPIAYFEVNHA